MPSHSLRHSSPRHLRQADLAQRWGISPRTLERWRWLGGGPPFLKIGARVAYRLEDIEAFEVQQRHAARETLEPHSSSQAERSKEGIHGQ